MSENSKTTPKAGNDYIGVSVGALIFNEEGQILLTKRSQKARNEKGSWEAPGGAVEYGELRIDAIRREVREELGVDIEILDEIHTSDEILEADEQHWVPTTYLARIHENQTPSIQEPEKCEKLKWFDLDDLPKPLSQVTTNNIAEFKRQAQDHNFRNILVTLECFVKKDGKFLMLHRKPTKKIMPDVWMAPGGKREFNEGLFAACHREIHEETNLKITNLRIRATGSGYLEDLDQEVFFHFVFADYVSGELPNNPDDGELVWLSPEEIQKLPNLLSEIKHVAPFIFDETRPVISYTAVYSEGNKMIEFAIEEPNESL
ncbi:MAG: NUDIX domain-containing protein [Microgenomates group bacterium]